MPSPLTFLLSPAHAGGKRASYLLNPAATFDLAVRLRTTGLSIADAFSFLSGLYFRGKVAYANRFARPPETVASGGMVITTCCGLVPMDRVITRDELLIMGGVPIDADDERYRTPLVRDAATLSERIGKEGRVVLLGSIATAKYVGVLTDVFGDRLLFPKDFVGRGDMSRGALMLRAAASGKELEYVPVLGAVRTGKRAPKVVPAKSRSTPSTSKRRRGRSKS